MKFIQSPLLVGIFVFSFAPFFAQAESVSGKLGYGDHTRSVVSASASFWSNIGDLIVDLYADDEQAVHLGQIVFHVGKDRSKVSKVWLWFKYKKGASGVYSASYDKEYLESMNKKMYKIDYKSETLKLKYHQKIMQSSSPVSLNISLNDLSIQWN